MKKRKLSILSLSLPLMHTHTHAALTEDPGSVLSTHIRWLATPVP